MAKSASPWLTRREAGPSKRSGTALCLSGGGYRAMVYHLGALKRLNEAGWLPRIDLVSSVSGGSITASVLASRWNQLQFDGSVATNFDQLISGPIRTMSRQTIDIKAALRGLVRPGAAGRSITQAYQRTLDLPPSLQQLPDRPNFAFNATNFQSGVLWAFMKADSGDYRVGYTDSRPISVATAVAASSGFPPVLAPLLLDTKPDSYRAGPYTDLPAAYRNEVILADGGVYDNLGLELARGSATVLVSNGSGPAGANAKPGRWILPTFMRTVKLINRQVRSLRKRLLFDEEKLPGGPTVGYWHIWMDYGKFDDVEPRLPVDQERARQLAAWPTRLKRMDQATFEGLVNWGYASCDVVLRKWVDPATAPPAGYPYPRGVSRRRQVENPPLTA